MTGAPDQPPGGQGPAGAPAGGARGPGLGGSPGYWQQFDGRNRPQGARFGGPVGPTGPRVEQLAIFSLVASVIGLASWLLCAAFPLFFSAAGLVLGLVALRRIKAAPELYGGRGLAIGGAVVGLVGLVLFFVMLAFFGVAIALDSANW